MQTTTQQPEPIEALRSAVSAIQVFSNEELAQLSSIVTAAASKYPTQILEPCCYLSLEEQDKTWLQNGFTQVFRHNMKSVLSRLGKKCRFSSIEYEYKSLNDGFSQKARRDNSLQGKENCGLTAIYFFHFQPKEHAGGGLKVNGLEGPSYFDSISNSIVFIDSSCSYEITEVWSNAAEYESNLFLFIAYMHQSS